MEKISSSEITWSKTNNLDDIFRADISDYMPGDILVKVDRASMANAIELRAPFLDVDFASGTRRYICTGFISSVDRKPRQAVINLRFECYKATGEDTTATTTTKSGKTTTPYTDTLAVGGSAPAQPIITITLNSFTGTSLRWMKFKNVDTGEAVLITASDWAGSDSIIINCETMIVTKNGVAIAYNGFVPTFPVGTVNWEYSDSFTARNVNIVFAAKHRWL